MEEQSTIQGRVQTATTMADLIKLTFEIEDEIGVGNFLGFVLGSMPMDELQRTLFRVAKKFKL